MTEWKAKRFWTETHVVPVAEGFAVHLDSRPLRTPARVALTLPTEALARAVAAEWAAQAEAIDPQTMPMTRSANSAIDKVRPQVAEVVAELASYGETDLTCHRADSPAELSRQQAEAWDPLLDWAAETLGARLLPTVGVMAHPQPAASLAALTDRLAAEDAFALCALSDLVALSGSVVIGLAAIDDVLPVAELWRRSRIDESWQESQWGEDSEAAAVAAARRAAFFHAAEFHRLSRTTA